MKILDVWSDASGNWIFAIEHHNSQYQLSVSTEEQKAITSTHDLTDYFAKQFPSVPSFVSAMKGTTI